MWICLSLLSFGLSDGGAWSVAGFLCMVGACMTWSMETVFPFMFVNGVGIWLCIEDAKRAWSAR